MDKNQAHRETNKGKKKKQTKEEARDRPREILHTKARTDTAIRWQRRRESSPKPNKQASKEERVWPTRQSRQRHGVHTGAAPEGRARGPALDGIDHITRLGPLFLPTPRNGTPCSPRLLPSASPPTTNSSASGDRTHILLRRPCIRTA
jgi:hypothetical protein